MSSIEYCVLTFGTLLFLIGFLIDVIDKKNE
jgi:hypothetical protein